MSRHKNWLELCLKKTTESEMKDYQHSAVLVKGGRLLGIGINNSKRGIIFHKIYGVKGFHAEADILSKFEPDEVKGCTLYVAGKSRSGNILNSKPCELCQQVILEYSLKAVYYLDRGYIRKLEENVI